MIRLAFKLDLWEQSNMKTLLALCITSVTFAAYAQTSSTSQEQTSSKTVEDIDTVITDSELRAKSGSKSKWSSTLSFTYLGGPLSKPFGEDAPNVDDSPVAPVVRAGGDIGFRYRIEQGESIYLATGFSQVQPFHNSEENDLDLNNPRFMWNSTFKIEDIQMSNTWGLIVSTTDQVRDVGQIGMLMYALSALTNPGQSRVFTGLGFHASASIFDKNEERLKPRQVDYAIALAPKLQYKFADNFKAFTSLQLFSYRHVRSNDHFDMDRAPVTQNLGANIAVRRDIFVSPYINFIPEDIAAKKTAVNLSTTINMF